MFLRVLCISLANFYAVGGTKVIKSARTAPICLILALIVVVILILLGLSL